jgi:drug/metabolite transporter (DMT)-like permease
MRTQRRLEKISTTISWLGLVLGFSALGLLIVAKEHDGGASIAGGILGILLAFTNACGFVTYARNWHLIPSAQKR